MNDLDHRSDLCRYDLSADAACCATCGGPFTEKRVHIAGKQYHERCSVMSYPSHTPEDYQRVSEELWRLRARAEKAEQLIQDGAPQSAIGALRGDYDDKQQGGGK